MPFLKCKANSSVQLESMRNAFGQQTITNILKNLKPMASQKLPVPYGLDSITAPSKGSPAPYEEGQHREMHLHGPGDPDQTVLC